MKHFIYFALFTIMQSHVKRKQYVRTKETPPAPESSSEKLCFEWWFVVKPVRSQVCSCSWAVEGEGFVFLMSMFTLHSLYQQTNFIVSWRSSSQNLLTAIVYLRTLGLIDFISDTQIRKHLNWTNWTNRLRLIWVNRSVRHHDLAG